MEITLLRISTRDSIWGLVDFSIFENFGKGIRDEFIASQALLGRCAKVIEGLRVWKLDHVCRPNQRRYRAHPDVILVEMIR